MQSETLSAGSLVGKTVVLIETEAVTKMYLRKLLSRAGLHVVGDAATGQEGIRMVAQYKPDIVLLDTSLPDMEGTQVSLNIRHSPACVVLLTCVPADKSRKLTLQGGANGFIEKPAGKDLILARLQQICGSHSPS